MPQETHLDERSVAILVERSYPVMMRIAGSLGKRSVDDLIVAAWEEAFRSGAAVDALETVAFRALLERLTESERSGTLAVTGDTDDPIGNRFEGSDSRWEGFWRESPIPIEALSGDTKGRSVTLVTEALERMPLLPRAVTLLRDFAAWSPARVASVLGAEPAVQRALLRTGREHIIQALQNVG